jgi:hypothetical protein
MNAKEDDTETEPKTCNKQINLLTWKDMPQHLQFNPYVHTGKLKTFNILISFIQRKIK